MPTCYQKVSGFQGSKIAETVSEANTAREGYEFRSGDFHIWLGEASWSEGNSYLKSLPSVLTTGKKIRSQNTGANSVILQHTHHGHLNIILTAHELMTWLSVILQYHTCSQNSKTKNV